MTRYIVSSRADLLEQHLIDAETATDAARIVRLGYGTSPAVSEIHDRDILDVTPLPPLTPKEQSE